VVEVVGEITIVEEAGLVGALEVTVQVVIVLRRGGSHIST
jgi:hypothetical protein